MNKVILIGKLTKEVEFQRTTKDLAIATLSVETSEKFKGRIKTQKHRVTAFGAVAEACSSFLIEDQIYIEGRSIKNMWEKDGIKRYTTTIIASTAIRLASEYNLGINKAICIGRLGANPEIRYTNDGVAVAVLSIATNEKSGDISETQWHRVITIGKLAEICERYLEKGRQVCIEGRIQTRSWKKNETAYTITEIVASNLEMLGSKSSGAESENHLIASQSLDIGCMDNDIPF